MKQTKAKKYNCFLNKYGLLIYKLIIAYIVITIIIWWSGL
jgi:hypothetical protein